MRLLGTKGDWLQLREKVADLAKYKLDWWISKLLPVIDKFVAAYNGESDPDFWNSCGKIAASGDSGSFPGFYGWLANFFPYIKEKRNDNLKDLD